jgi:DNA-binding Xre family transcriptional regulator
MGTIRLKLREVAQEKGVGNPYALANETGLTYSVCYKLWHEQTTLISLPTLAKLCDGLKVCPGELFDYRKTSNR